MTEGRGVTRTARPAAVLGPPVSLVKSALIYRQSAVSSGASTFDIMITYIVIAIIGGMLAGWLLAWLGPLSRMRDKLVERDTAVDRQAGQLEALRDENSALRVARAEADMALTKEREAAAEKLALLDAARERLSETFQALSAKALQGNNQAFLELARAKLEQFQVAARGDLERRQQAVAQLVSPMRDTLERFDVHVRALENARAAAYEGLQQQVRGLHEAQTQLRDETANLARALRAPSVRGRWGEIQLKRVVEMAGMLDHCDFHEQPSVNSEDGRLRPDLIVHLPGNKSIVVDAKAVLSAYLESIEAPDEAVRQARLQDHARHVREHITALSRKSYWEQFQPAPEFVVLFLPGESFFSAALEQDPALIETGVEQRVILATPTTLIALLKAVAYGWRQENLAANAQAISDLGRELYGRIADLEGHFSRVGRALTQAVTAYNQAVGTFERRVLVSARRFEDLKAADTRKELAPLNQLDSLPRELTAAAEDDAIDDVG